MAQTGNFTPILLYASSTVGNAPAAGDLTNSTLGSELAINIADGKLFYKDSSNAVQVIGWKTTPTTAGGTGLTSYTAGDMVYWASGTTFSKLAIGTANYIMTSSGTAPQWSASIGPAQGGTGITSYAVGDLIYASGTTTLSKLADVATGNALISGGVGVAPSWGKIGLTTHVSGTLGTGNGGTGLTGFTAANNAIYSTSSSALTAGTLPIAAGGTGLTSLTAGYIPYGNGTSAFSSSANLTFDGTSIAVGTNGKFGGSLSVGGATPAAGAYGLSFPASQASSSDVNTLDDYEEGTWTPQLLSDGGTATGKTYSQQKGQYVKIGKAVFYTFWVQFTNSGSNNVNECNLAGFPFPSDANGNYGGDGQVVSWGAAGVPFANMGVLHKASLTTAYLPFSTIATAANSLAVSTTMYTNTFYILGFGQYFTTT